MRSDRSFGELKTFIDTYCETRSESYVWRKYTYFYPIKTVSLFLQTLKSFPRPPVEIHNNHMQKLYLIEESLFTEVTSLTLTDCILSGNYPPFFYPLLEDPFPYCIFALLDPFNPHLFASSHGPLIKRINLLNIPHRVWQRGTMTVVVTPRIHRFWMSSFKGEYYESDFIKDFLEYAYTSRNKSGKKLATAKSLPENYSTTLFVFKKKDPLLYQNKPKALTNKEEIVNLIKEGVIPTKRVAPDQ